MTPDQDETTDRARTRAALAWFVRLRDPHSARDRDDFAAWRAADRRNAEAFVEVEHVWRRADAAADRVAADEAPALAALLATMHASPAPRRARRRRFALVTVAACLLMTLAAATMWLERPHLFQNLMTDQTTGRGEVRTVTLPDGSTALLDADSALDVAYDRDVRRVTLLRGAAYFTVASNGLPFVVAARGGKTRVVGTQFEVRLSGGHVVVTVAEGRVDVMPPQGPGRRLNTDQRLRYGPEGAGAISTVDPRDLLAWREGRLVFRRARLDEVVEILNRYRAGRILLLDDALAARTVSGSFQANDTDNALDSLRQIAGFRMDSLTSRLVILRPAETRK